MSQPVALLVGGTKILERALQTALPVEVVIVATMEEAAKVMGERDVALVVLGPTLRRALAMVATLRREGAGYPRLIVVYRDDQRDEVRRHQRGKAVADGYVPLSRIAKELAPLAQAQWHEGTRGQPGAKLAPLATAAGDELLDEVEVEAFEVDPEAGTRQMDVLPPLDDGETVGPAPGEGTQELDLSDVVEVLDENGLEELPDAAVAEESPIEELSADEIVAEELIEEIPSDELVSENVTHVAQAAVAAVDATAAGSQVASEMIEEVPESALEELAPDAVQPSSTPSSPQVVARIDAAAEQAAKAAAAVVPRQAEPGAAPPVESTRASRPQSGAYAMLGELTGFVERLQEASQLIHQLEGENEQLRQEVARLKQSARPELATDLGAAQQKAKDLQLRLEGAERARDAAVEARMKFEQQAGALRDEIERRTAEIDAARAREAALESQLDARRRIAQDAAKSLRAIGQMIEG